MRSATKSRLTFVVFGDPILVDKTLVFSKANIGPKRSWTAWECAREVRVNDLEIFIMGQRHLVSENELQGLMPNLENAVLVPWTKRC
jgi:hypothetical protein